MKQARRDGSVAPSIFFAIGAAGDDWSHGARR
jgi:hypothetical protein